MKKKPVVAVALGGGGALGFAHIGVLDVLKENNIPVDIIVGTSMGAIVGAFWCNNASADALEKFASSLKTRQLIDINLGLKGLISGGRVVRLLQKGIPKDQNIEDLPIKFACNAVNIKTGQEVLFEKGNLLNAVRASMSVPGIFVPAKFEGNTYVDGGVKNNLPHMHARNLGADIVIAVDVVSSSTFDTLPRTAVGVLTQAWLISQQESQKNMHKFYNIKITPHLPQNKQYVFDKDVATQIIEEGRVACEKAIPKIVKLIQNFEN